MKATKKVIGSLEKCYALGTFSYDGKDHIIIAAEKKNPCYSFDLQGNFCETLWEGPGGVMTVAQVPEQPILMATQKFYSPNDSADAKIVYYRKINDSWVCEVLCPLPFVHRFGVLKSGGKNYLIACTLKSAHAFKNDWTCPGRIWVAPFPDDITVHNADNPLSLTPLISGLYKNHGFEICHNGADDFAVIACENGVFKITPPASTDGNWTSELLLETPASDVLYLDFDNDGERELLVLSPFHGDSLTIYKKTGDSFEAVYRHPKRLPFLHAIWGAAIDGRTYGFIGNREEDRDLFVIYWDGKQYVCDMLDQGAGATNVLYYQAGGQDLLLAANRETDEIAIYTLITKS